MLISCIPTTKTVYHKPLLYLGAVSKALYTGQALKSSIIDSTKKERKANNVTQQAQPSDLKSFCFTSWLVLYLKASQLIMSWKTSKPLHPRLQSEIKRNRACQVL